MLNLSLLLSTTEKNTGNRQQTIRNTEKSLQCTKRHSCFQEENKGGKNKTHLYDSQVDCKILNVSVTTELKDTEKRKGIICEMFEFIHNEM